LAAGLCPDPLGELKCSLSPPSRNKGPTSKRRGGERKGRMEGKGRGGGERKGGGSYGRTLCLTKCSNK